MFRYLTTWSLIWGGITIVRIVANNAKAAGRAEGAFNGYVNGWADAQSGAGPRVHPI